MGPAGRQAPLVLALDIGTSSARAALFDTQGNLIEGTLQRVSYRLFTDETGRAELDTHELARSIDDLLDRLHAVTSNAVEAVGISCFWHSLVGLDEAGYPVTPVSTWADTRARDAAADLRGTLDARAHHSKTGAYLHPSYPVARLVWLQRSRPEGWQRVRWWCAFPDWLLWRWTGVLRTSLSMASGSGLLDQRSGTWHRETCEVVGVDQRTLPPIDETPLRLASAWRTRWPRFANAQWFPAWGDGACSNVGSSGVGEDRLTVMIGTSAAVRVLWRGSPVAPPWGLWLYRLDGEHVLLGGALSEGGNLVDWIRRTFALPPEPELWERVARVPVGARGLRWVPTIAGERSLRWPVDAVASLTGVRLGHDGIAVLRAALEAVTCRLVRVIDLVRLTRPTVTTFVGSGNALLGIPGWPQMLADALGTPLHLAPDPEGSLRGAALVALTRWSGRPLSDLARPDVTSWARVEPRREHTPDYRRLCAELEELERLMSQEELTDEGANG